MKKIETDIREYIRPSVKIVTLDTLSDTLDGDEWTISGGDTGITSDPDPDDDNDDNRANYFNAWDDMSL